MNYLLDTNACVSYLRGKNARIMQRFARQSPADLVLCSVVVGELCYGAFRSGNPTAEQALVDQFVAGFVSLPFNDVVARVYARVRYDLETRGLPIGENDYQIAAIALVHDLTLVTHNTREFSRVTGLRLEDWEVP